MAAVVMGGAATMMAPAGPTMPTPREEKRPRGLVCGISLEERSDDAVKTRQIRAGDRDSWCRDGDASEAPRMQIEGSGVTS